MSEHSFILKLHGKVVCETPITFDDKYEIADVNCELNLMEVKFTDTEKNNPESDITLRFDCRNSNSLFKDTIDKMGQGNQI